MRGAAYWPTRGDISGGCGDGFQPSRVSRNFLLISAAIFGSPS